MTAKEYLRQAKHLDTKINTKLELKAVSEIEDEDCRLVIEKRYLNNEPWDEIAMDMNCSIDNVFKIHGRALKKFKIPERLQ